MTRNHVVCTIRAGLLALAVGVSATLSAMPTQQELSKADPLIQELMGDDLSALRTGKKTREQVGDTAAALAKQAQSPAEKYLLFTGAFDQYMRGGNYEKAHSALSALRESIPDWKSSDEFALIEKALRSVAFGKGGPVRGRYEALKERQQYALRLKKALSQVQAKPTDKKLQFQVAAYYAALDRWPQALDAFIAGSNPACAAAAKFEKESSEPGPVADAWWSTVDIKPDFLSSAIRSHAVELYKRALAANSLAGLQKLAAEKRISESETAAVAESVKFEKSTIASSSPSSVGTAKYYGVELVGGSVKESKGIISGFANKSCAKIKAPFDPQNCSIEAVVEFKTGMTVDDSAGILNSMGGCGFSPCFILNRQLVCFLSSKGFTWDIASGVSLGLVVKENTLYRVKITWDRNKYVWYVWNGSTWRKLKEIVSSMPVFGSDIQFGTGKVLNFPFSGTIDLNKCYICIDGKLFWEGEKGAYRNANR